MPLAAAYKNFAWNPEKVIMKTEIRLEKIKNCAVIKSGKSLLITTKW